MAQLLDFALPNSISQTIHLEYIARKCHRSSKWIARISQTNFVHQRINQFDALASVKHFAAINSCRKWSLYHLL